MPHIKSRKRVVLLMLAILFVCVFSLWVFLKNNHDTVTNNFTLIKESGNVYYKVNNDYVQLQSNEIDLYSDINIKTDNDSSAYIILQDNSIVTIDQNSEIHIDIVGDDINITQITGNTWHRVRGLKGEYKVITNNYDVKIRGTIFAVNILENEISVAVLEHSVEIQSKKSGKVEEMILNEGQQGSFAQDKHEIKDIDDEFKDNNWYKKNVVIDEKFKKNENTDSIKNELTNVLSAANHDNTEPEQRNQNDKNYTIDEFKNKFRLNNPNTKICNVVKNKEFIEYKNNAITLNTQETNTQLQETLEYIQKLESDCENEELKKKVKKEHDDSKKKDTLESNSMNSNQQNKPVNIAKDKNNIDKKNDKIQNVEKIKNSKHDANRRNQRTQ